MTTPPYSDTFADRLNAKLRPTDSGCLEFIGCRTPHGYGHIGRGRRGDGYAIAHRAAWELAHGPIPEGLFVCHHCDNPPCCNVDHLFLGTAADNNHDRARKGRTVVQSGERHKDAKLTTEQVAELRRLAPIVRNHAELGRRFGISKQHARAIVLGQKRRDG